MVHCTSCTSEITCDFCLLPLNKEHGLKILTELISFKLEELNKIEQKTPLELTRIKDFEDGLQKLQNKNKLIMFKIKDCYKRKKMTNKQFREHIIEEYKKHEEADKKRENKTKKKISTPAPVFEDFE